MTDIKQQKWCDLALDPQLQDKRKSVQVEDATLSHSFGTSDEHYDTTRFSLLSAKEPKLLQAPVYKDL